MAFTERPRGWYQLSVPETPSLLDADSDYGLTTRQIGPRQQEHGKTVLPMAKGKSPFQLLVEQFKDPMI